MPSGQSITRPIWGGGVLAFLFGALMEELGLQVPLSSEQRAQGTRHPTVPRSQTPFLK